MPQVFSFELQNPATAQASPSMYIKVVSRALPESISYHLRDAYEIITHRLNHPETFVRFRRCLMNALFHR